MTKVIKDINITDVSPNDVVGTPIHGYLSAYKSATTREWHLRNDYAYQRQIESDTWTRQILINW